MSSTQFKKLLTRFVLLGALILSGCASTQGTGTLNPEPKATGLEPGSSPTTEPTSLAAPTEVKVTSTVEPTTPPAPQTAGETVGLRDIQLFTPQVGWATDTNGRILHTTQGPAMWEDVTPAEALPESGTVRAVPAFLDENQAWVAFHVEGTPAGAAKVWHTTDAGVTWAVLGSIPAVEELNSLVQMVFVDEQYGWLLGQIYPGMMHVFAVLFATTDGGATWEIVSSSAPDAGSAEGEVLPGSYSLPFGNRVFTFLSHQTGYAGVKDLYRTQTGGTTWSIQMLPEMPNAPVLEQPYNFVSTPQFSTPEDGVFIYSLYEFDEGACPPCDIFFDLPKASALYVTHNGGQAWTPLPAPAVLGTVDFIDAQTGWFLGINDAAQTKATLYSTADGGHTWIEVAADTDLPLGSRLDFITAQIGFASNPYVGVGYQNQVVQGAAGQDPYLYQTADGGKTWEKIEPTVIR